MATKTEDVIDLIKGMTLLELKDLNDQIKDVFGVTAMAPMAMAAAPAAGGGAAAAPEEEQTEFQVVLKDFSANKINVIKAVREVTTLGLKEAKDLVEAAPANIGDPMAKPEAETVRTKLVEAGATVDLV